MNRTVPKLLPYKQLHGGILVIFVILMMLFCSFGAAAREVSAAQGQVQLYAQINPKNTEEIQIHFVPDEAFLKECGGETLYLFALGPYEEAVNLRAKSPTATKVVEKNTRFSVTSDKTGERLRAKYVLALGEGADYRIVGEAYVINPEVLAQNTAKRTPASTIKGLVVSGALSAEAQALGIGHAVIPIVADKYMSSVAGDPQYSWATAGQATHFDPVMIQQLDALVASLQTRATHITFRFLLDGSDRGTTEPAAAMYAELSEDGAVSYGFSLETKTAYQTANNLFSYFADRYAADAEDPIDFIIGYQVNEWVNWYNLGYSADHMDRQIKQYAGVFRLADLALRSHSANSRVYVPLSNLWATGRPFLTAFAAEMGSDTAWSVAVAPYASSALDDSIWDDPGAKNDPYSTYLTMNNLGILKTFLEDVPYLYQNKRRAVIVDDFAVHGTSGDTASQERQAASFVYAYYQAVNAEFLDAFIWHRVIDGAGEQCSLGLRQLDAAEKPVYALFSAIDTERGSKLADPYAKVAGERRWSSLIKGFSAKKAERIAMSESEGTAAVMDEVYADSVELLNFTDRTLHGFAPYDYMESVSVEAIAEGTQINTSVLTAVSHAMKAGQTASVAVEDPLLDLPKNTDRLYLTVKVDALAEIPPAEEGTLVTVPATPDVLTLQLQLEQGGEDAVRYHGQAAISEGTWTVLAFDVSDYARTASNIDLMRLSVIGGSSDTPVTYTLSLDSIRYDTGAGLIVLRIFTGILIVLLILVLIFALLVVRAQIIRRRRRRQRAAQRAAYLARQRRLQAQQRQQQTPGQSAQTRPTARTAQRRPDLYQNTNRTNNDRTGRR